MSLSADFKHPAFAPLFLQALGGILLACFGVILWLWISGDSARRTLIDEIPSETVKIGNLPPAATSQEEAPSESAEAETDTDETAVTHAEEPHTQDENHGSAPETNEDDHNPRHGTSHEDGESRTHEALADPDLTEDSPYGPLPVIGDDGTTPFDAYKIDLTPIPDEKTVSLVIRNLGLSPQQSENIIRILPENVTLAFSPYTPDADNLLAMARDKNQEIWLTLPLEHEDGQTRDTGPLSLRNDFTVETNQTILKTVMGRQEAYAGLIGTNADETTLDLNSPRIQTLISSILDRGLGFAYEAEDRIPGLQSLTGEAPAPVLHIGQSSDMPFAQVQPQLDELMAQNESFTLIISAYPAELDAIAAWTQSLSENGYSLVPLSTQAGDE